MPAVSSTITCIGIDWADKEHVFHLIPSTGRAQAGRFCQEPDTIHDTVESWKRNFPDTTIAIAIEQSRGPLINGFVQRFQNVHKSQYTSAAAANQNFIASQRRCVQQQFDSFFGFPWSADSEEVFSQMCGAGVLRSLERRKLRQELQEKIGVHL